MNRDTSAGTADSIFGSNTEQAVKALQSVAGITVDGKVGKEHVDGAGRWQGKWQCCTGKARTFKLSEFKCKDGTAVPAKYYAALPKADGPLRGNQGSMRRQADYDQQRVSNTRATTRRWTGPSRASTCMRRQQTSR